MAGTALKRRQHHGGSESITRDLVIQFNKAVADVELLRGKLVATAVKLDADTLVGDTNYAAQATITAIDTAAELLAAKIGNEVGTAISA